MGRPKKVEVNEVVELEDLVEKPIVTVPVKSEKDMLLELYTTLKGHGINSIGDLENKIANCR